MLNNIDVLAKARDLGSTRSLAEVDAVLATFDYPTLRAQDAQRYRVELWDKTSSINGVPAETILGSYQHEPDQVYLIFIDNNLVYMQSHDPNQMGWVSMDAETATSIANSHIDDLVEQKVDNKVLPQVLRQLL